jgi:hypothetical protein
LKHLLRLILAIITLPSLNYAQSLEETLSHLSKDAAVAYVNPVISAFGSNMNGGWIGSLPSASLLGLNIELRLIGNGSFVNNNKKNFATTASFNYTSAQVDDILSASGMDTSNTPNYAFIKGEILSREWQVSIEGPTIIGSGNEFIQVSFPGAEVLGVTIDSTVTTLTRVNGFLDGISLFPTPAIQLDVGSVAGTQVSFRYFPGVNIKDMGKTSLWGFGILHNPGFWFSDPPPVKFGLGFFYQKLDIGNVFQNNSMIFGLYLSKPIGVVITFEPYLGATYETSSTKMNYSYVFDSPLGTQVHSIAVDFEGENRIGFTFGAKLNFPVVSVNIDYKIAVINSLTAGIGLGF